ncbi:hypothetical protein [Bacillus infantis]|uniref:hypothetical protein n=1 Tax=Bacillus infantis TaxID=324767 RepID=UPI000B9B2215|nr:hypothetical protein B9K06_10075 [Bacillus sp. OG2]
MDQYQKQIKQALDKHFFDQLTLSETEAAHFASSIKKKPEEKPSKRIAFIFPALAVGFVLLFSFLLVKPFVEDINNVSANIQEQATEEFGHSVFIPEIEGYSINFAAISYPLNKEAVDLTIDYGTNTGKWDQPFANETNRERWEKEQSADLLYGPYQGKRAFSLQYRPNHLFFEGDNVKERELNGISMQYEHIQRDNELVMVSFKLNEGTYFIDFLINENFTLADSEKVLDDITKQVNKISR